MNIIRIAQLLKAKPVRKKSGIKEQKVLGIFDGFDDATDKELERVLTSADSRMFLWNLVGYEEMKKKPLSKAQQKELDVMRDKVLAKIEAGTL